MQVRQNRYIEAVGWLGTGLIILAFALISYDFIDAQSYIYLGMNLVGAMGVVAVSLWKRVYQTVILNIFWIGIAAIAAIKHFLAGGI